MNILIEIPKLAYTVEERIVNENGCYYSQIHVWSGKTHLYGYQVECWFDSYNDAHTVAHIVGKEELERVQASIERTIKTIKEKNNE